MSNMERGVRTDEMQEHEQRKSGLLLRGHLAKELGQHDGAAKLFGEAAALEEALAQAYAAQGISEQVWRHEFSVGCTPKLVPAPALAFGLLTMAESLNHEERHPCQASY